mmetsp:Transcript_557/g.2328  ORF Transcript_557/g.2328 Transcript_557/m.2328 type:complete len:244 (+) Transcript_557:64-795(+)
MCGCPWPGSSGRMHQRPCSARHGRPPAAGGTQASSSPSPPLPSPLPPPCCQSGSAPGAGARTLRPPCDNRASSYRMPSIFVNVTLSVAIFLPKVAGKCGNSCKPEYTVSTQARHRSTSPHAARPLLALRTARRPTSPVRSITPPRYSGSVKEKGRPLASCKSLRPSSRFSRRKARYPRASTSSSNAAPNAPLLSDGDRAMISLKILPASFAHWLSIVSAFLKSSRCSAKIAFFAFLSTSRDRL